MFRRRGRRDESATRGGRTSDPELEPDELEETDDELDEDAGEEEAGDRPEDMTADLESQAADYLAGNDVWMYGPNAEAVLEILDRLEEIGPSDARPIAEAWLAIPRSDRDRARRAARKLAESDADTSRYLQMAKEAVGTWMAVTGPYPEYVNAEPDWGRLCTQSGEAALDAATAVILEGQLDELHYESLIEPWSESVALLESAPGTGAAGPASEADDDEAEYVEEEEEEGKFGPNSDAVTDFLNRLWLLSPEQIGRLVSGWQNVDRDQLKTAHEGLRALVEEDTEWRDQVRHAQEELAPWLNAGRIEETSGFLGMTGHSESRKMAGPALADAIAALVLGDLLDRGDAITLYGPWYNLVGAPPLPEESVDEPAKGPAKSPKSAAATPAKGPAKTATAVKGAAAENKGAAAGNKGAAAGASGGRSAGQVIGQPKPQPKGKRPEPNRLSGAAKPNVLKKK
jgi:hypothetical protein